MEFAGRHGLGSASRFSDKAPHLIFVTGQSDCFLLLFVMGNVQGPGIVETQWLAFCRIICHGFLPFLLPFLLICTIWVRWLFFFFSFFLISRRGSTDSGSIPFCTGVCRVFHSGWLAWADMEIVEQGTKMNQAQFCSTMIFSSNHHLSGGFVAYPPRWLAGEQHGPPNCTSCRQGRTHTGCWRGCVQSQIAGSNALQLSIPLDYRSVNRLRRQDAFMPTKEPLQNGRRTRTRLIECLDRMFRRTHLT